jgi:nicotinate-nucleotide adenylyltransferase
VRSAHPDAVVAWVLGSDAYAGLTRWHRWREIFELANVVVLRRPGAALSLPDDLAALTRERQVQSVPRAPAGGVFVVTAPMLNVSATGIRRSLRGHDAAAAGAVADLLPPAVYTYIKEHHLYGVVSDA